MLRDLEFFSMCLCIFFATGIDSTVHKKRQKHKKKIIKKENNSIEALKLSLSYKNEDIL